MSLQPCAMPFAPQQTQKARSLIARFCALAKSEHPANVRKRLPRCRSFPCIDVFARQLSHPHPGAHSPQACCPAQHLSTQPDPHLSPIPHLDSPNPAPTHTLHRASSRGRPLGTQAAECSLDGQPACFDAKEHLLHDGQAMKSWSSQPSC